MFPLDKGAPFIPNSNRKIQSLLNILIEMKDKYKFQKAIDLGSGDGRIAIALTKEGFYCDGVELNKLLYKRSVGKIQKSGLGDKCKFFNEDFFKINLNKYDLIVLWQSPQIMSKLSTKLKNELVKGTLICSYYFKIPHLDEMHKKDNWHIYEM
ncbi:MAG TPA: class I SAM-dependent methyltransferase [Patescibacteria group bacterium]|nr:class I SAM-dependent methyltransferase [bacterium]HRY56773.1 class I SAM-dependent methyltransferase [Patescibacteria group bacterium]